MAIKFPGRKKHSRDADSSEPVADWVTDDPSADDYQPQISAPPNIDAPPDIDAGSVSDEPKKSSKFKKLQRKKKDDAATEAVDDWASLETTEKADTKKRWPIEINFSFRKKEDSGDSESSEEEPKKSKKLEKIVLIDGDKIVLVTVRQNEVKSVKYKSRSSLKSALRSRPDAVVWCGDVESRTVGVAKERTSRDVDPTGEIQRLADADTAQQVFDLHAVCLSNDSTFISCLGNQEDHKLLAKIARKKKLTAAVVSINIKEPGLTVRVGRSNTAITLSDGNKINQHHSVPYGTQTVAEKIEAGGDREAVLQEFSENIAESVDKYVSDWSSLFVPQNIRFSGPGASIQGLQSIVGRRAGLPTLEPRYPDWTISSKINPEDRSDIYTAYWGRQAQKAFTPHWIFGIPKRKMRNQIIAWVGGLVVVSFGTYWLAGRGGGNFDQRIDDALIRQSEAQLVLSNALAAEELIKQHDDAKRKAEELELSFLEWEDPGDGSEPPEHNLVIKVIDEMAHLEAGPNWENIYWFRNKFENESSFTWSLMECGPGITFPSPSMPLYPTYREASERAALLLLAAERIIGGRVFTDGNIDLGELPDDGYQWDAPNNRALGMEFSDDELTFSPVCPLPPVAGVEPETIDAATVKRNQEISKEQLRILAEELGQTVENISTILEEEIDAGGDGTENQNGENDNFEDTETEVAE